MIQPILLKSNLLPCPSNYRSKMILDGTNCFGRVQIILLRFKLDFSGLVFIVCTYTKLFGPTNWTRPKWLVLAQVYSNVVGLIFPSTFLSSWKSTYFLASFFSFLNHRNVRKLIHATFHCSGVQLIHLIANTKYNISAYLHQCFK